MCKKLHIWYENTGKEILRKEEYEEMLVLSDNLKKVFFQIWEDGVTVKRNPTYNLSGRRIVL